MSSRIDPVAAVCSHAAGCGGHPPGPTVTGWVFLPFSRPVTPLGEPMRRLWFIPSRGHVVPEGGSRDAEA